MLKEGSQATKRKQQERKDHAHAQPTVTAPRLLKGEGPQTGAHVNTKDFCLRLQLQTEKSIFRKGGFFIAFLHLVRVTGAGERTKTDDEVGYLRLILQHGIDLFRENEKAVGLDWIGSLVETAKRIVLLFLIPCTYHTYVHALPSAGGRRTYEDVCD